MAYAEGGCVGSSLSGALKEMAGQHDGCLARDGCVECPTNGCEQGITQQLGDPPE